MSRPLPAPRALCAVVAVLGLWPAAAPGEELYLGVSAGVSLPRAAELRDAGDGVVTACLARGEGCGGRLDRLERAGVVGLALGWRPLPWLETELEAVVRIGGDLADQDQGTPEPSSFAAGVRSRALFWNAYAAWPVPGAPLAPFVGAGLGVMHKEVAAVRYMDPAPPASTGTIDGGARSDLAWQAMAGLRFAAGGQVHLRLFYRHVDGGALRTGADGVDDAVGAFAFPGLSGRLVADEVVLAATFRF